MNVRKITARPGFELVFAIGIAAIFIIPSAVMAQSNKSIEITINNGDTVINGKNIKELNQQQRMDALKDLNTLKTPKGNRREMRLERRTDNGMGGLGNQAMLPPPPPGSPQYGDYTGGNRDKPLRLKMRVDTSFAYNFKFNDGGHSTMIAPMRPMDGRQEGPRTEFDRMRGNRPVAFTRRNSQSFNYVNTDGQGTSTRISYRVMEPDGFNTNQSILAISDVKLVPDFNSGKTTLMFNLPSKASAEVVFTNGEGKVLWSEKWNSEIFTRSFPLPLNGRYELRVKQGGKMIVKQIIKEE